MTNPSTGNSPNTGGFNQSGNSSGPAPSGSGSQGANIVDVARNRATEVEFGGDRAIGAPPNWNSQASSELYRGATVNNDPATAEALSQAWGRHSEELRQAASDLYNAISELGTVWLGQAAGAAQGALAGIAGSSSQAGQAASSMGTRLAQQASAAAELKKMPGPKEFDPAQAVSAMLAGGPAAMVADQKAQFDLANDVKSQQVAYYDAYTQALSEVDSSTPSFGPEALGLPRQAGAAPGSGVSLNAFSGNNPALSGAAGVGVASALAGAGIAAGGGQPLDTAPVTQAGFHPDNSTAGAASGASTAAGAAAPSAAPPASSGGSHLAQQLGFGAFGAGVGLAAGKTLNAGSRSGAKQNQPGQTSAASDTTAEPASNENAPAAAAGQSKSSAAATPAPSGMATPMGAGAATSAQDDEEHKMASFLVEPDPDSLFGADQATPHPVIGSWEE